MRDEYTSKNPKTEQLKRAIVIRQSKRASIAADTIIEIAAPNNSDAVWLSACSIVATSFKSVAVKSDKSFFPKYERGSFRILSAREIRTLADSS